MGEGQLERRIVTVLFADLVGFTPLSERLDAEDVAAIQDAYFAAVRETVTRYGGRLEKFIGDAAVAAFGLPRARDDDPERSARAGHAIVNAVEQLAGRLGLAPGELQVRVGIQTGEIVHQVGGPDDGRMTGDTVNTAARLQTAAPPGGVLLGEPAALAVAEIAELEAVAPLTLKGKGEPVRACLLTGFRPERSRDAAMGRLVAPTIGRGVELARLRDALGRLGERGYGTERWMVVAPPGVGKSRLVGELLRMAAEAGVPAVRVRARHEPEQPFGPAADLLRATIARSGASAASSTLAEFLHASGLTGPRLAFVAGELAQLAAPHDVPGGPTPPRDARFDAWLEGLDRLDAGRPTVWVVEDLHWASPDLVAFVRAATDRDGTPRLLVVTSRPSLIERAPDCVDEDAARGRHFLDLRPLPPADAARLVGQLVGAALPPTLVERIAEHADGNPLFIEELLRGWVSSGTLVLEDGGWRLALDPDAIDLPPTVQAIYAGQLDDLPEAARRAARRASVSGRTFPTGALEALDVPEPDVALETLLRRAIVGDAPPDPIGGPSVAFRHALLRDAGYASLARAERALLHLRLARWLEVTAGDRAPSIGAAIGTHWELAVSNAPVLAADIGDGVERATARASAARWLEEGAAAARQLAAHEAAADLLRRAVALTDPADATAFGRRLIRLADADRVTDLPRAADGFEWAMCVLAPLVPGDPGEVRRRYTEAATKLSQVRHERLEFARSAAIAADARAVLGPDMDVCRLRVDIEHSRATVALDNDYPAALVRATEMLARAHELGDPDLIRLANEERVGAAHEADQAEPDDWAAVVEAAEAAGDVDAVISAATNRAMLLLTRDPTAVSGALESIDAIVEARRLREEACWIDYVRVEAGLLLGEWDDVIRRGLGVMDTGVRHGFDRAVVRTLFALVPVAARRADRSVLERAARWYHERRSQFPVSPYGLLNHGASDVCFRRAGLLPDEPPDFATLRPGLALGESGPATLASMETVVDDWIDRGAFDTARQALEVMEAAGTAANRQGAVLLPLLRLRLAVARGAADGATAETAREVATAATAIPMPWWAARAWRVVEATSGDPREAGTARRTAADLERRLGVPERATPRPAMPDGA